MKTNRLLKNSLFKNVVILIGGTAGAQILTLLFTPFITRIYGPDAFGILGSYMAIVACIGSFCALSYPIAIVLPKSDYNALKLGKLSLYIATLMSFFTLCYFILGGGEKLFNKFGMAQLSSYVLLFPAAIILIAWQQVAQQWLTRKKAFSGVAIAVSLSALVINTAKLFLGLVWPFAFVLVGIQITNIAIQAIIMTVFGLRLRCDPEEQKTSKKPLIDVAKRYKDFALFRTPQDLINAASQNLPVLMLVSFLGAYEAGLYTLARMILIAPGALVSKSVGSVFYPEFTEAFHAKKPLLPMLSKYTAILLIIVLFPFLIIILFGPSLFSMAFGDKWHESGQYARWLAIMVGVGFANRPCVVATATLGLQRGLMIYEIISTALKVAALYIGIVVLKDDKVAIIWFSVAGGTSYLVLISWVLVEARKHDKGINSNVLQAS